LCRFTALLRNEPAVAGSIPAGRTEKLFGKARVFICVFCFCIFDYVFLKKARLRARFLGIFWLTPFGMGDGVFYF